MCRYLVCGATSVLAVCSLVSYSAHLIVTPFASKASVWTYFGYMKDLTTGRAAVGKKATCKLCLLEVAHSGGTNDVVTRWNSTLDMAFGCANSRLPLQLFFMGSMTSTIWSFLLRNGISLKTLLSYLSHLGMQPRTSVDRSIPHFLVLAQHLLI